MQNQFFTTETELNEAQIDELVQDLTKGCQHKTKVRVRSLITYDLDTLVKNIDWFRRFYIASEDSVRYCAGQSYPCELRAIRNEMLRLYP